MARPPASAWCGYSPAWCRCCSRSSWPCGRSPGRSRWPPCSASSASSTVSWRSPAPRSGRTQHKARSLRAGTGLRLRTLRGHRAGAVRELPARAHEVARVPVGVALQVVLVLRLGLPERAGRRYLGDHLARPQAGGVDVGDRVLGGLLLRVAEVEDGRPVAGPDVVALPVHGGRVVDLEEELQQVAVGDPVRVEGDLDRLGVAAVVAVRRVRYVAARVADPGREHAGELADEILHAPETAAGQDGLLGRHDVLPLSGAASNSLR